MGNKSLWAQISILLGFIALFFTLNLVTPDKEFSEQENRYLQQKPQFTFFSLFSGKYMSSFEAYITDQFEFRDSWTALKARCELLLGKGENNGVYLCNGDTLIEAFEAPDASVLDSNLAALNKLVKSSDIPVYFGLIPGAADIWSELMPENAPNDSQQEVIDYCYSNTEASAVDISTVLETHDNEYIFYRTDHHWTSLGAYYGYTSLMDALGLVSKSVSKYSAETVSNEFYGTIYSSSGFSWVDPDSIDIYVKEPAGLVITNYPEGQPVEGKLYDFNFIEKKDKYSMFLGGNTPLQQIKTGIDDAHSLLIIRDSYTDSLVPFMLESFSEIHLIDLRYYRASLSDYIQDNDIDKVLILYGVKNFCTDSNIFLLGE